MKAGPRQEVALRSGAPVTTGRCVAVRWWAMITVNGEPLEHNDGMTVDDVLQAKRYIFRMLAVSVDGELVPRKAYKVTRVPDGADVQVIHMMSGG